MLPALIDRTIDEFRRRVEMESTVMVSLHVFHITASSFRTDSGMATPRLFAHSSTPTLPIAGTAPK
jgi:hypothetical protein